MSDPTMVWISGWASDLSQWSDVIHERFSGRNHVFVDYGALLSGLDDLYQVCPELKHASHVVAWSMGTLALLRQNRPKVRAQRWTLFAPFLDFCAAEVGWPRRTVQLMARQVLTDSRSTLGRFADLMGPQDACVRTDWLERALCYTPQQLADGLHYLAGSQVSSAAVGFLRGNEVRCVWNRYDQVVQAGQAALFGASVESVFSESGEHWFLDYLNS